jgi:hypothetical protein
MTKGKEQKGTNSIMSSTNPTKIRGDPGALEGYAVPVPLMAFTGLCLPHCLFSESLVS